MNLFKYYITIKQELHHGIKMPAVKLLFLLMLFVKTTSGSCGYLEREEKVFQLVIPEHNRTFSIPYYGLTSGDCYRLISRNENWRWNGNSIYTGQIEAAHLPNGQLENIPIPENISAGEYEFDLQIGITAGSTACYSDVVSFQLEIIKTDVGTHLTICSGEAVNYTPQCLTDGQSPAEKYHWTRSAVEGIVETSTNGVGDIHEILTNSTNRSLDVKYVYLTTADACSKEGSFEVVVTVKPRITFEVENSTTELCSGETTRITLSPGNIDFQWEAETADGVSGTNEGIGSEICQTLQTDGENGTVTYRIKPLTESCSEEQTTTVTVNALPEITLDKLEGNSDMAIGRPIKLNAWPDHYDKYVFRFNGKITEQKGSELTCYEWRQEELNDVAVSVVSKEGCKNTAEDQVYGPKMQLPNAFTPNGDGINDRLLAGFELEVFDLNNGQLYKGKDGWDGTYNGSLVPTATYYYVIKYKTPEGTPVMYKFFVYVQTGK
ncbi:MAG: gliding motility-associated C-terminal domain-containing protein [Odoribacter sp.]